MWSWQRCVVHFFVSFRNSFPRGCHVFAVFCFCCLVFCVLVVGAHMLPLTDRIHCVAPMPCLVASLCRGDPSVCCAAGFAGDDLFRIVRVGQCFPWTCCASRLTRTPRVALSAFVSSRMLSTQPATPGATTHTPTPVTRRFNGVAHIIKHGGVEACVSALRGNSQRHASVTLAATALLRLLCHSPKCVLLCVCV